VDYESVFPDPRIEVPIPLEFSADSVTISHQLYVELCEKAQKLDALEAAGVNNWEGYGTAMRSIVDREENEAAVAEMLAEASRHAEGDTW